MSTNNNVDGQTNWQDNAPETYALSGKIMLSGIIVLFLFVIFMVILHMYARWYLLRIRRRYLNRRRSRRQRATHIVFYVDPNSSASVPTGGLEASVLSSLPFFIYSSRTHPDGIDCAVCLSEFEENEKGRILPKCHHSFHTNCIDMWFHSHSTCPICRTPVEAEVPVHPPQNSRSELMVSIDEGLQADPAGSSSMVCSDRTKGLDLVGVRIEVPRGESVDELRLSSPTTHGFKSPGSRLQSLKRIVSLNRRSVVVSPTSGIGTSGGPVGAEFDIELGTGESRSENIQESDKVAAVTTEISKKCGKHEIPPSP